MTEEVAGIQLEGVMMTSKFNVDPMSLRYWIGVECKIINKEFIEEFGLPSYATPGDAGMDLRADLTQLVGKEGVRIEGNLLYINPGQTILIPTGVAIYIRNVNYAGKIYPRSGLGHKEGLVLGNLTGIIDSTYQGQLMVSLWNRSTHERTIKLGDRIAQYVLEPVFGAQLNVVDEFRDESGRGEGGFGSSGRQ